jgi:hypothetical protein
MRTRRCVTVSVAVLLAACGDFKLDETPTSPNGPPPGSTTSNGSVAANISGVQFAGRLPAAATIVETRLTFSAYDGDTRQLSIAVGAPGPGAFDAGGPYNPIVTLTETTGDDVRRWVSASTPGSGTITLTFLTENAAVGHFLFSLLPDSATVAAGITTRRNVTAGTFNIAISR